MVNPKYVTDGKLNCFHMITNNTTGCRVYLWQRCVSHHAVGVLHCLQARSVRSCYTHTVGGARGQLQRLVRREGGRVARDNARWSGDMCYNR